MFSFQEIEVLWALLLCAPLILLYKQHTKNLESFFSARVLKRIYKPAVGLGAKTRHVFLVLSLALCIVALARPQLDNGEIEVKTSFIEVVVGFDLSKSMFANDVYPSRFAFAKEKFKSLLEKMQEAKLALIGFSSQAFLIAPLTQDYHSLRFLSENLNSENLSLKGTNLLSALEASVELFKQKDKRALLLFTDGGDASSYEKELAYAKKHNIRVYIYAIGTQKGGVIEDEGGVLKDGAGNIVVVKRNDTIKLLALESNGAYLQASSKQDDMSKLINAIRKDFVSKDEGVESIRDTKELFMFPLALALVLFISSFSSLRRAR